VVPALLLRRNSRRGLVFTPRAGATLAAAAWRAGGTRCRSACAPRRESRRAHQTAPYPLCPLPLSQLTGATTADQDEKENANASSKTSSGNSNGPQGPLDHPDLPYSSLTFFALLGAGGDAVPDLREAVCGTHHVPLWGGLQRRS